MAAPAGPGPESQSRSFNSHLKGGMPAIIAHPTTQEGEIYDFTGTVRGVPGPRPGAGHPDLRICQLQTALGYIQDEDKRFLLQERIHMLSTMLREARELAVLTERYYDRGYHRNAKYTL